MIKKIAYTSLLMLVSSGVIFSQTEEVVSTQTVDQPVPVVIPSNTLEDKVGLVGGKVIVVYDGDSLSIRTPEKKIYSIRLQGIDAPEGRQTFGQESREALRELLMDKDVDVLIYKKDLYDRYVGTVYLNGQDINLWLIENGMAWHYKKYADEQTSEDRKKYSEAEETARSKRIGLWKEKDPTPPWDYGRNTSSSDKKSKKSKDREYIRGPRGGCYYLSGSGRKVYVKDKSLCDN